MLDFVIIVIFLIFSVAILSDRIMIVNLQQKNHANFPSCVITSSIISMRNLSRLVCKFKGLQSPQNLQLPSFFTRNVTWHAYFDVFLHMFLKWIKVWFYLVTPNFFFKKKKLLFYRIESHVCLWHVLLKYICLIHPYAKQRYPKILLTNPKVPCFATL
jgi:hypothetical protein